MKFQTRSNHLVDFVFTIALFFVFAGSSLAVILLASNVYRSTSAQTQDQYSERTALSYITQKVRQSDSNGNIQAGSFHDTDALIITDQYNGDSYITYIYAYKGNLRELYMRAGAQVDLDSGRVIVAAEDFSIEETSPSLLYITVTDLSGASHEQYIHAASEQKG